MFRAPETRSGIAHTTLLSPHPGPTVMSRRVSIGWILLLGVVAAAARAVYLFLPAFLFIDLVFFALLGMVVGRGRPLSWWHAGLLLSTPAVLLTLWLLGRLGLGALAAGVGIGHLVAVLLVPASALAGAALGARRPPRTDEKI